MESIHKLEKTVAGWYKNVPHLPVNSQKWLATNVWWLALIGLILMVLAIFPLIGGILFAGAILSGVGAAYGDVYGATSVALTGIALLIAWTMVAFLALEAIILGLSISPLKAMKKKGWDLLFILALVNVASVIVGGVLSFNLSGLVFGLLWSAIGAYFLFEIRGSFDIHHKAGHKPVAKKAEKA